MLRTTSPRAPERRERCLSELDGSLLRMGFGGQSTAVIAEIVDNSM